MERVARSLMRANPSWRIEVKEEEPPDVAAVASEAKENGFLKARCNNYARISLTDNGVMTHATCIVIQHPGNDNRCHFELE